MATKITFPITIPSEVEGQPDSTVDVTLRKATIEDSSLHEILIIEADQVPQDGTRKAYARKQVALYVFPHCVACIESPEDLRDMPLEKFRMLSDDDINTWAAHSQTLNNHWWERQREAVAELVLKMEEMTEDAKKKIGIPSHGSPTSTTTRKPKKARSRPSRS